MMGHLSKFFAAAIAWLSERRKRVPVVDMSGSHFPSSRPHDLLLVSSRQAKDNVGATHTDHSFNLISQCALPLSRGAFRGGSAATSVGRGAIAPLSILPSKARSTGPSAVATAEVAGVARAGPPKVGRRRQVKWASPLCEKAF